MQRLKVIFLYKLYIPIFLILLTGTTTTGKHHYKDFFSHVDFNDPYLGPLKIDQLIIEKLKLKFENAPKQAHIFNWYQMEGYDKVEFHNTYDSKITLDNIKTGEYWVDAVDKDGNIIATAKGIVLVEN